MIQANTNLTRQCKYMDDFFTLKFLLETRGNLMKGSPEEIKT
jgi:hypothetical protein